MVREQCTGQLTETFQTLRTKTNFPCKLPIQWTNYTSQLYMEYFMALQEENTCVHEAMEQQERPAHEKT